MDLNELLPELEKATGPSRILDAAIGRLVGYKRKVEYRKSNRTGGTVRRVFWIVPSGDDFVRMPHFTDSLDAAVELASIIVADRLRGVSWVNGTATACIDDGAYYHGATPALAICIAVLSARAEADAQGGEVHD
ncbi:hypothetical protein J2Z31_000185 [Sinorhizobium kostiense]|uniref:Phage ABA sandwich domain-containing protein n=1 Tax=Sinorhizobium kostiense TaxID=76747 RepID=A0ABS4QSQ5_9HYPH|nr:hypothetical protein [Sinorhizobium kostiense]MBP2233695.1 hypothetical protein [Sinorhizobium kostiense]